MTPQGFVGTPRERDRREAGRVRRSGSRRAVGAGHPVSERSAHRFSPRPRPLRRDEELVPEVRPMPDADRREQRPRTCGDDPPDEAGGRGPTLGDLVTSAWEGLLSAGSAPCPACGERMRFHEGTGHCGGCGARLS